jgi:predicted RNase H-like HicB family nuclease
MDNSIHINISRLDTGDYVATSREFKEIRIIGESINDVFTRIRKKIEGSVFISKK